MKSAMKITKYLVLEITVKISLIIEAISVTALENDRNLNQKQNIAKADTSLMPTLNSSEISLIIVILTISNRHVANREGIRRISK